MALPERKNETLTLACPGDGLLPAVAKRRATLRQGLTAALFCLLFARVGNASNDRIILQPDGTVDEGLYAGIVELVVIPPFEGGTVAILIDGNPVVHHLRTPYRLKVDLGAAPVHHQIAVTVTSTNGKKKKRWEQTINKGAKPLTVKVSPIDTAHRIFEAIVTVPRGDSIARVDFYDDTGRLLSLERAPYRLDLSSTGITGALRVIARTASGTEATDMFADRSDIHGASYDVRTVKLIVSVTDRDGKSQTDLRPSLFEVVDNGTRGKILEVGRASVEPISLAILLDSSASMRSMLPAARNAAFNFVKKIMRKEDRCSVYAIQSVPRRQQPLTSSMSELEQAFRSLKASGGTAIYDALRTAVRELESVETRKAIVLLTDGGDTASIMSYEEALQTAKVAGIPIYVIVFGDVSEYAKQRDQLAFLAAQTGGFLTSTVNSDLPAKYEEIEKDLRGQYSIRYQITDVAQANEWRNVKVMVKSPQLTARTISGYFTP